MEAARSRRSLEITVILGLALLLWTVRPYLVPMLLGGMLALLTRGLFAHILTRLPRRRALAALLATVADFFVIVLPLLGLTLLVATELADMVEPAREYLARIHELPIDAWLRAHVPEPFRESIPSGSELITRLGAAAGSLAGSALSGTASVATDLGIDGFLLFVSTYYFFLGGEALILSLERIVPLERRYKAELAREFRDSVEATIYGNGITALAQGALLFVLLLLVRVPHALVWASVAAVTSLAPLLGSALVWVPVGVVLLLTGEPWRGAFVLAGGTFLVSTIDNFLRPLLIKGKIRVHPLLVFLSIFGGLSVFGAVGIIFGPVIAALVTALVRIWERDWQEPVSGGPAPLARV